MGKDLKFQPQTLFPHGPAQQPQGHHFKTFL
jgi:hypothetical protein